MFARFFHWLRRHPRLVLGLIAVPLVPLCAVILTFRSLHQGAVLVVPSPTLLIEDVRGRFIAEVSPDDNRKGFWPLPDALPSKVVAATLAAEDARFYEHAGVDWQSLGRAVWQNVRHRRRISGASTIAMQVARMQDPGARTYQRKLSEAVIARELVKRYGHEAVLRQYLLIAPYGNQNHGIVYAARRFFDKYVYGVKDFAEYLELAGGASKIEHLRRVERLEEQMRAPWLDRKKE